MKKFDIDCESLQKGDIIPVEKIEELTGYDRGSREYAFGCLSVRTYIEDTMRSLKAPVTICSRDYDLVVLTDSAAFRHSDKRVRQQIKGVQRSHRRMQEVDTTNLTPDEQQDYERRLLVQSRYVQAINSVVRRKIEPRPHVRTTPVMAG